MDAFRERLAAATPNRGDVARLSRLSGVNASLISRWRDGGSGRPTTDNLAKIAPHLGLSYAEAAAMCGYPTEAAASDTEREILEIAERMRPTLALFPRENWGWVVTHLGSLLQALAPATEIAQSSPEISSEPPASISKRPVGTNKARRAPDAELNAYELASARLLAVS